MTLCILASVLFAVLPAQAGALTFTRPPGWTDRAAASSMRVAEFVVPKASGDDEDGELIVYYFGGTGGTVEANLQRWTTQFQSTAAPVRTTATVNGLQLTNLDVSGTYVAEVRPGATERHNKPGFACGRPSSKRRRGRTSSSSPGQPRRSTAPAPRSSSFSRVWTSSEFVGARGSGCECLPASAGRLWLS